MELFCVCDEEEIFAEQLRSIFYKPLKLEPQPGSMLIQASVLDSV